MNLASLKEEYRELVGSPANIRAFVALIDLLIDAQVDMLGTTDLDERALLIKRAEIKGIRDLRNKVQSLVRKPV